MSGGGERASSGGVSGAPLVEFSGIGFGVPGAAQPLLQGLDARIEAGGATVVLGPNGSGKSLTLRLAHGLLRATEGQLRWRGEPAGDAPPPWQAMVFERPIMLRRSAAANIEYGLALRGVAPAERRERALAMLERIGLAALADRAARRLSAGEQQRVAIARAWACEPMLLFLDEPTASLDVAATARIESLVTEIVEAGTKVVMTTHDLGQARRLASEILFIAGGRLCERGPAAGFFEAPRSPEARAFLQGELFS